MSQKSPSRARPIRNFFRGVGEILEFTRESAFALFELAIGRWPQPFGARRRPPKPPNEGMSPLEKIAPFPCDD